MIESRWWQRRPTPPPPEELGRQAEEAEAHDPPAVLLRLPPWSRDAAAGRVTSPGDPAAGRRDCRFAGFSIGTPVSRFGAAKLWRARGVDLRRLFRAADAGSPLIAGAVETPPGRRRHAEGAEERGPSPEELLRRRLPLLPQPPPEMLMAATGPLEWPGAFFPYQRDGIAALVHSPHLLLGDDMGLGKTVQAVAALRLLFHRREIERALVVAPASLLEQWRRDLTLWAPELRVLVVQGPPDERAWRWQYRAHVSVASYETVRADVTPNWQTASVPGAGPCREPWSVIVLDEAQRIKNRDTDLSRACKRLPRRRSWALTGTPVENRAEDLLSILEFVLGRPSTRAQPAEGPALRATLSQFHLRRRKADVLKDLPPKITSDLVLPLTPSQRRAYDRAEQEGVVQLRGAGGASARIEHVLALITRLKQICNFAPDDGASAKMEDLESRIEELSAAGSKALVFTQYTGDESGARRIARRLARFSPLLYTGDMSPRERSRTVDRFQQEEGVPVLILSLQAGGQGLNLQRAAYVFHFDRSWNPAVERQAEDRAYRLGQTQPVNVYRYVMADTIEERIDSLLKSKRRLFEQIVEGASLDPARLLDQEDLFGLVGLAPPHHAPADPTGGDLEERVAALLARQGYRVVRAGGQGDGGVDVIGEKRDSVGARLRLYVQCKATARPAGVESVRSLCGALPPGDRSARGVVACPAGFTPDALRFAAARQVELWDEARLTELEG